MDDSNEKRDSGDVLDANNAVGNNPVGNQSEGGEGGEAGGYKRRVRYSGTHPRKFAQKYKEQQPDRYQDTVQKVLQSGKTPAGTHRPIMVNEILEFLRCEPGNRVVDATLGWGGHTQAMLQQVIPGGHVLGLDCDPIELPRTEARLRATGFGPEMFTARRTNYAGLLQAVASMGWEGADRILADLGVSSMQLDDPTRGFSVKNKGPLDMRMNPNKGLSAAAWLERATPDQVTQALVENADEPYAESLGRALAGRKYPLTVDLAGAVRNALQRLDDEQRTLSVRRVFQALRIVVNDEFQSLDTFLRHLPQATVTGARIAILTFHSGEDRRVKRAFREGLAAGIYAEIAEEVGRASPQERRDNPRSSSAKLRWAVRSGGPSA